MMAVARMRRDFAIVATGGDDVAIAAWPSMIFSLPVRMRRTDMRAGHRRGAEPHRRKSDQGNEDRAKPHPHRRFIAGLAARVTFFLRDAPADAAGHMLG